MDISISEIDLVDSFYQFAFEEVASFFCVDHPLQAKELSISEVYDDDLGRFDGTHPDEWLFPAFRVMPMGWSWSLWLCQNALVDAMVASGVARTGQPRPDVEERVLVDHRPAPFLAPGKPILAPYVDSAIIFAWSPEESRDANRHLASLLSDRGFAFRVEVGTARDSTAVGFMFDGIARIFRNKPSRVWRLYYAIDQLIRQKRASCEALRIVVSHTVSQFLLRRCFLSALSEIWGRIESTLGRIEVMPPRVVAELRCCAGLFLICRHGADRLVSCRRSLTLRMRARTGTRSWRGVRTIRNWSAPAAGGSVGVSPPSHPNR